VPPAAGLLALSHCPIGVRRVGPESDAARSRFDDSVGQDSCIGRYTLRAVTRQSSGYRI